MIRQAPISNLKTGLSNTRLNDKKEMAAKYTILFMYLTKASFFDIFPEFCIVFVIKIGNEEKIKAVQEAAVAQTGFPVMNTTTIKATSTIAETTAAVFINLFLSIR